MATLNQNVVCIECARALYYSHSSYYGIGVQDFDTLSGRAKQLWVERAQEALEAVGPSRPTMRAEVLAGFNDKVIGSISPEFPWGETA